MWTVYIVECRDQTFYTGIALDLERRLEEHNTSKKGAKYVKGRRPVKLVYSSEVEDKSGALKEEHRIKNLTKLQKLSLIQTFKSKRKKRRQALL